MDKGGESDKASRAAGVRAVDERQPPAADKTGGASDKPAMVKSDGTSDRPSATAVERTVDGRGTTGDGGPEVKDKNGNSSDMPPDEVDDGVVNEGRNKIFRLEGAVYSIGHFVIVWIVPTSFRILLVLIKVQFSLRLPCEQQQINQT
eukprot:XP_016661715.1 PREDICTED: uncharacterized protein LOC107884362 [Acyrthosiphon pisum]